MATDADRARQREEWRKAVTAARHAQRAARFRRAKPQTGAGMVRVQARREESDG